MSRAQSVHVRGDPIPVVLPFEHRRRKPGTTWPTTADLPASPTSVRSSPAEPDLIAPAAHLADPLHPQTRQDHKRDSMVLRPPKRRFTI